MEKRSRANSKAVKEEEKPEVAADGPTELFVKSLSYNTTEDSLRGHFEQFGTLTKCKLNMRAGQPSGTGFVEYESPADAAKALEASNGAYLDDRQMWCEFSGQQTGRGNAQ